MGLEVRQIDQWRYFMFANGKGGGQLGRILGIGMRKVFASFRRCRRGGWEAKLAKGRYGVGRDATTRRWRRPLSGAQWPAKKGPASGCDPELQVGVLQSWKSDREGEELAHCFVRKCREGDEQSLDM